MKKALKFITVFTVILLCLALMASCTDKNGESETSDTTAESTSAQTTAQESSATSDTESESVADTEPAGIRPGTDGTGEWGEFEPV